MRLRIYFQIVTPTVRLRIGGAADAVTTAYGGVVVFKRNMNECLFEEINHPVCSLSRSSHPS